MTSRAPRQHLAMQPEVNEGRAGSVEVGRTCGVLILVPLSGFYKQYISSPEKSERSPLIVRVLRRSQGDGKLDMSLEERYSYWEMPDVMLGVQVVLLEWAHLLGIEAAFEIICPATSVGESNEKGSSCQTASKLNSQSCRISIPKEHARLKKVIEFATGSFNCVKPRNLYADPRSAAGKELGRVARKRFQDRSWI